MNLCDDGHDEVCYEVRDCPACKLKDELYAAFEKLEDLEREG